MHMAHELTGIYFIVKLTTDVEYVQLIHNKRAKHMKPHTQTADDKVK